MTHLSDAPLTGSAGKAPGAAGLELLLAAPEDSQQGGADDQQDE
jgi:hypothetical protein